MDFKSIILLKRGLCQECFVILLVILFLPISELVLDFITVGVANSEFVCAVDLCVCRNFENCYFQDTSTGQYYTVRATEFSTT